MSYRAPQPQRPQTSVSNQMKDLNRPPELYSVPDMFKVMDTYKRSVDYYNSHGLDQRVNSTRGTRTEQRSNTENSSSFWNYN